MNPLRERERERERPSHMATVSATALSVTCSISNSPSTPSFQKLISSLSSPLKEWRQAPLKVAPSSFIKTSTINILDAIVDSAFKFVEQPVLNEGNFAPVDEIGDAVPLMVVEGEIPDDFPQGIYIRNGPNHLYPKQTAAISKFGISAFTWVEGDGMLHATYFSKDNEGNWRLSYKNRYVEAETFQMEKQSNKPLFIPSVDGQPTAMLAAFALNMLRFGKAVKESNNTNVFEHGGRLYAIAENHMPYEIDVSDLSTVGEWEISGAWCRPFSSHPKRAPRTGDMVTMGVDVKRPFYVLGVISADGKRMLHKVDLKFKVGTLIHEVGVTENYNIIMDYPLRFGTQRLLQGKSFFGHDKEGASRIGVMPRFGDAESIFWFDVKSHCSFHIINSFEDGNKVILRGCRTTGSIIPGPDHTVDKAKWYLRAYMQPNENSPGYDPTKDGILFSRPYEWVLDMKTGAVREGYLARKEIAMDFPAINTNFTGYRNKYAYTQVVDSIASSKIGIAKYKMLAKLNFDEQDMEENKMIKVEYHRLEDEHYCSGAQFVEKPGGIDEDDGWVVCYVHDEKHKTSKVYIIDAKEFTEKPVAKITLPQRVPYGFHATFMRK